MDIDIELKDLQCSEIEQLITLPQNDLDAVLEALESLPELTVNPLNPVIPLNLASPTSDESQRDLEPTSEESQRDLQIESKEDSSSSRSSTPTVFLTPEEIRSFSALQRFNEAAVTF